MWVDVLSIVRFIVTVKQNNKYKTMGVDINCILGHRIKFNDIKSLPARMTEDAALQLALQRYCNVNTVLTFEWDDEYPIVVNRPN